MQISHLPVRGRKLPRVMGGSTGSTKEICETSCLPIPMVPRLHQCNGYIKRKLRAWRVQKCNALVGADIALTCAGPQTTPCHGGQYRVYQGNMRTFGPPIPMVPRLHQCNGNIKMKLRALRVQKCIALVVADIAFTSAGPQTIPCHGGQYRVRQGNMRNFGPTNTHGTASAPMQWLYQMEPTGM